MPETKRFFRDRTVNEIRSLRTKRVTRATGLVEKVLELDEKTEALVLEIPITPIRFRRGNERTWNRASRLTLKHGDYIKLSQPETITEACRARRYPHEVRREDFHRELKLSGIREAEIFIVGYSFEPIQGRDKRKRLVPFVRVLDGARLFAYAMQHTEKGIEILPYDDAARVSDEGAVIIVSVLSKRKKIRRYIMRVGNIPVVDNERQYAIAWGFTTEGGRVPEHKIFNFRYKGEEDQESSNVVIVDDKDIAAMHGITREYWLKRNKVPWENNVFAKPSQLAARYDTKLRNNLLVYDPTLSDKEKLRHLHLAERSILIARLIGHLGHDKTMFWEQGRDPKLQDYDWGIS